MSVFGIQDNGKDLMVFYVCMSVVCVFLNFISSQWLPNAVYSSYQFSICMPCCFLVPTALPYYYYYYLLYQVFSVCVCVLYAVFMCAVGSEREEVGKECHFNYLIAPISWFNFPPLIPFFFKGEGVCTHAHRCVKQFLHYIVIYTHSHQLDCV